MEMTQHLIYSIISKMSVTKSMKDQEKLCTNLASRIKIFFFFFSNLVVQWIGFRIKNFFFSVQQIIYWAFYSKYCSRYLGCQNKMQFPLFTSLQSSVGSIERRYQGFCERLLLGVPGKIEKHFLNSWNFLLHTHQHLQVKTSDQPCQQIIFLSFARKKVYFPQFSPYLRDWQEAMTFDS